MELRNSKPLFRLRAYYKSSLKTVDKIITDFSPSIIVSGQDYPLSVTTLAAHIGARRGIRTVIIRFQ